jgi:hypothetical protein
MYPLILLYFLTLLAVFFYFLYGWNVNEANNEGYLPLHFSATVGSELMIEYLLSLGIAPHLQFSSLFPVRSTSQLICALHRSLTD